MERPEGVFAHLRMFLPDPDDKEGAELARALWNTFTGRGGLDEEELISAMDDGQ
jgi:hypothetical protein